MAVQRGARHIPHTRGRPAAGNVDGIGAGEAERFVEPNQRVLGGLQIRRCCGVGAVAQLGSEQGRGQTLPPDPRRGAELVQIPVRLGGVAAVQGTPHRKRCRHPGPQCRDDTRGRGRLVRDPAVSGGVLAEMTPIDTLR